MHDHAPRGSATLTRRADCAEKNRLRRHFEVGARRHDERVIAAEFHDRSAQSAMNRFGDVQAHVYRPCGRDQWNPRVIGKFLANRFAVAHEQREDRRISAGFTANALGDFRHCNCGERSFLRWLPNGGVAADGGQRGVPRPDCDGKIKRGDHGDDAERMPLLHQSMTWPFRLDRQTVKHARLANGQIADVDHLLHFAFAFGDDLSGLQGHELAELVF